MLELVLLVVGIWKTLTLPGIHRYEARQFPQMDPEKFKPWKRAELEAAYVFLVATWGALLVKIVVGVLYAGRLRDAVATSQMSATEAEDQVWTFTIGVAVVWFVGIVIAAGFGSRAKAMRKSATLATPATPATERER